ncbi:MULTISPECIES: site-specific DNA-methyltransferase [Paenibacillus]|uniref:site-specific DNA-methyltransferase n=1 Tax=Paenibacillus TaxID=44249 RepID=UPI0009A8CE88|nr:MULTISPECIES: site-specific DNA-methyltransferase [Paenibacillus]MCZ1265817.1 site-specific DNA-methyltransferase [Paenibacillus tundrae]SLK01685.1 adenine-specific DNA-methyltransferase [Paenibacillus sp. RU5A]SOC68790.1 adenine-specific DNA-methyltransferase [Paenibacillus sp. RU26A]SOC71237.1 adenine-specific DNA-methyltransferase [Paenibacillus sp. RU5M]
MPTLEWIGKEKVINHHQEVPFKIMDYKHSFSRKGISYEEDLSANKIIHGDNLEALKSLLPQYEGKIKCIYIDPPYNTGNKTWVYNDDVNHPKIKKWFGEVVGKEEEDLSRHDKWLCMMYPRLKLLHKLLSDDGIIFVSIDDTELPLLRIIMDEIFGKTNSKTNMLSCFIWQTDGNFDNQAKVKVNHEYILAYAKNTSFLGNLPVIDPNVGNKSKIFKEKIENTIVKNGVKNPVSGILLPAGFPANFEKGIIQARDDVWPHYSENLIIENYKLCNPVVATSGWSSKDICQEFIDANFSAVLDSKGQNTIFHLRNTGAIYAIKERKNDYSHVVSVLRELGSTQQASASLKNIQVKFDYPKPVTLVQYLISMMEDQNGIVLDSFAGSGTTAEAVLNLNKIGGNRKFILIEMEDYAETITAKRVENIVKSTDGNFAFYQLGQPLLLENNYINEDVSTKKIREYIFYMETKQTLKHDRVSDNPYYLGRYNEVDFYFYYEKYKTTTLNHDFLTHITSLAERYIIYADLNVLSKEELEKYNVVFKKIPRDIARL